MFNLIVKGQNNRVLHNVTAAQRNSQGPTGPEQSPHRETFLRAEEPSEQQRWREARSLIGQLPPDGDVVVAGSGNVVVAGSGNVVVLGNGNVVVGGNVQNDLVSGNNDWVGGRVFEDDYIGGNVIVGDKRA